MAGSEPMFKAIEDAPCHVALFRYDRSLLMATGRIRTAFPEVEQGLDATLRSFTLEEAPESLLGCLPRERRIKRFGKRTDGSIWLLSLAAEPEMNPVSLQAEEVTDRYDELLRQRVLLDLADKTPDGLGVMRADLSGLWINDSLKTILAVDSAAEIRDRLLAGDPDAAESMQEMLEQARREEYAVTDTVIASGYGKGPLDVTRIIARHNDPLTGEELFSTIIRDISSLKNTERALKVARNELQHLLDRKDLDLNREKQAAVHSRDVWRSLVEQNRDLVLFTDPEGNILFANRGFLPSEGSALIGTTVFSMISPRDRMTLLEQYRELIDGRAGHVTAEARVVCPDGNLRYCIILINKLEKTDGHHAATWIISDATEARQIREQLMANEKMAATGRMAARIAHEINNPLAAIKSSLELVRLDTEEDHPAREYTRLMEQELDRVSNIIRQMYGLYRPEQDQPRELDVTGIVADCLTLLDSTARQRGIRLRHDRKAPVIALASEAGLRQILFNLLQNALNVSPPGGAVLVLSRQEDDRVQVLVMDEGPGLDESRGNDFFEPFFTTKDSYGGSGLGLGLSVSASLAKGMAGDLQLFSMPGGGACATLTLPAAGNGNG